MQAGGPEALQRPQTVEHSKLHPARRKLPIEPRYGNPFRRNDASARYPHARIVKIFELLCRHLVTMDRLCLEPFQPMTLDEGDGAPIAEPAPPFGLRRIRRCPYQNARAVARKEIHEVMIAIDRPDERTIQPFPAERANGGNADGARFEYGNIGIVAEMEKPHGEGSPLNERLA